MAKEMEADVLGDCPRFKLNRVVRGNLMLSKLQGLIHTHLLDQHQHLMLKATGLPYLLTLETRQ